jgi:hypothetical protein
MNPEPERGWLRRDEQLERPAHRWAPISSLERRHEHLDTYYPRPVARLEREAS